MSVAILTNRQYCVIIFIGWQMFRKKYSVNCSSVLLVFRQFVFYCFLTGYESHKLIRYHPWSPVCLLHRTVLRSCARPVDAWLAKGKWNGWTTANAQRFSHLPRCANRNVSSYPFIFSLRRPSSCFLQVHFFLKKLITPSCNLRLRFRGNTFYSCEFLEFKLIIWCNKSRTQFYPATGSLMVHMMGFASLRHVHCTRYSSPPVPYLEFNATIPLCSVLLDSLPTKPAILFSGTWPNTRIQTTRTLLVTTTRSAGREMPGCDWWSTTWI